MLSWHDTVTDELETVPWRGHGENCKYCQSGSLITENSFLLSENNKQSSFSKHCVLDQSQAIRAQGLREDRMILCSSFLLLLLRERNVHSCCHKLRDTVCALVREMGGCFAPAVTPWSQVSLSLEMENRWSFFPVPTCVAQIKIQCTMCFLLTALLMLSLIHL